MSRVSFWAGPVRRVTLALGALALCVISAACERGRDPELPLAGTSESIDLRQQDFFVTSGTTVRGQEILTDGLEHVIVGRWREGQTGEIASEGYVQIRPGNDTARIPADARLERLHLRLQTRVPRGLPAQTGGITIEAHPLEAPLSSDRVYFANDRQPAGPPQGRVTTTNYVDNLTRVDTIIIDGDLAKAYVDYFRGRRYDGDVRAFTQALPGIVFRAPESTGQPVSVIVGGGSDAWLSWERTVPDRLGNDSIVRGRRNLLVDRTVRHYFALQAWDATGTPFEPVASGTADSLTTLPVTVSQNALALYSRVNIEGLEAFFAQAGPISIARAELILPIEGPLTPRTPTLIAWAGIPSPLQIGRNQVVVQALVNEDLSGRVVNIDYDRRRGQYVGNITRYMLQVQQGQRRSGGFTISTPVADQTLLPIPIRLGLDGQGRRAQIRLYYLPRNR